MGEAIRVLIAENDPTDAELVVRELRRAGFAPEWQRVETEADYLQALSPGLDIILSDFAMPRFSGSRALELLRERGLDVPFILVSGTIGEEAAVAAMKDGANDYLIKDRLARLGTAVRHAVEERRERVRRNRIEAHLHQNVLLLVQQAPICIAMFDRDMRYLATSHRWVEEYGQGIEDLIGRSHYDIFPDLSPLWKDAHQRGQSGEVVKEEEDTWLQPDGSRHWLRWAVHPWRDAEGAIGGIIISAEDVTPRKQAEAQRDELARQRQLALSAARLGWWHYDPVTQVTSWDERAREIFGVSNSPHATEEIVASIDSEDRQVLATVQAALDSGDSKPCSIEHRVNHPDGAVRWVEVHGVASFEGEGDQRRAVSCVGTVQDITERKRVEAAVREGEARLAGVVDSAMDAIVTLDSEQRILLFNAAAERMFRCSRDEAIGRPIDVFLPAASRDGHRPDLSRFGGTGVRSGSMWALNAVSGLRAGGEEFPIEASSSQTDVAGKRLYTVILRDITDRQRAERWQAMQHAVTNVLADSTSLSAAAPGIIRAVCETLGGRFGAIWEIDTRAEVLRCTESWQEPGLLADELEAQTRQISFAKGYGLPGRVWACGKPVVVTHLARDPDFPRAAAAGKAGLRGAFAFPILRGDGVAGVIDFLGSEVREPEPELLAMLAAIGSQIGQFIGHRSAERQLLQAQKMEAVGQLAGGIAHDFNNLLGVILGYAQLAIRELGPEHKTNRRLDAVCRAAERAAALTRQILTFSRQQNVETRICDLNHIVEDMERMLRRLIGEDVRLAVALGQDLGRVRADPGQLEQVIMNLAVNARDAMPRGGRLVLETSNVELDEAYAQRHAGVSPGAHVVLAISDSGEGMEPATLARIFEPFFTTKEPGKGTGLGLAVVFGIVKQSGGSLSVYSEPGRGTTFKVFLPRVFEKEMLAPPGDRAAVRSGSETVLVVEDEDALRGIVAETLREVGYTVLEAQDPRSAAALAAQETQAIHLLLSDVVLPGQTGPETANQLRKARPAMRVLLMSGYTDRLLDRDRGTEAPTPFLGKPFTIDALLRKVREVLDEGNPERQDAGGIIRE